VTIALYQQDVKGLGIPV